MRSAISIDLGTTYAVMARPGNSGSPQIILNRHGQRKTLSTVSFPGGAPEVGVDPLHQPPGTVVRCVKDTIGDPTWRFRRADLSFRSEEIVAIILSQLATDAERTLGTRVTDAVLTVPASFEAVARRALRDAGAIAGLRVDRLVNEPTAAALAYQQRVSADRTVLVYALGGGAFDVSVVRLSPDGVDVRATRGDRRLGGWNWDNVLMRLLQARLRSGRGPDLLRGEAGAAYLRGRAELLKRQLTITRRAETVVRCNTGSWRIPVTRTEFEAASAPLVTRTRDLVRAVLADTGLTGSDLDRVVLVGGPTSMPMVRRMLRRLLDVPLEDSIAPAEVVALGAALLASGVAEDPEPAGPGVRRPPRVREVASHGLGVLARDSETGVVRNVVVVPAGTDLPAAGQTTVTTSEDGQTRAVIKVTQGDSTHPAEVRVLGRHVIALPSRPAGVRIDVSCSYDAAAVPHVEVIDRTARRRPTGPLPVPSPAAMSPADVLVAARRLAVMLPRSGSSYHAGAVSDVVPTVLSSTCPVATELSTTYSSVSVPPPADPRHSGVDHRGERG